MLAKHPKKDRMKRNFLVGVKSGRNSFQVPAERKQEEPKMQRSRKASVCGRGVGEEIVRHTGESQGRERTTRIEVGSAGKEEDANTIPDINKHPIYPIF